MKKISVSAPCRVDFSGGTADLWPLYLYLGGLELVHMAINVQATTEIYLEKKSRGGLQIEVYSRDLQREEIFKSSVSRTHSLAELTKSLNKNTQENPLRWILRIVNYYLDQTSLCGKIRIETRSKAPPGSGLGGSSVLGISLAQALEKLLLPSSKHSRPWDLQQKVRDLEAVEIEHPAGDQDYVPALFKGLLVFHLGTHSRKVEKLSPQVAQELGKRSLLLYTGKPHHSGLNNWQIFTEFHNGNLRTRLALEKIKELSSALAADLRKKKINSFAEFLNTEWSLRQELSPAVNAPVLDEAWAYGKKLGATARKACGAGGGGCLLLYFDDPKKKNLAAKTILPDSSWSWLPCDPKF